jgi:hypothetical protein
MGHTVDVNSALRPRAEKILHFKAAKLLKVYQLNNFLSTFNRSALNPSRKPQANTFAPSAAMSMTLLSTTMWHLRICQMTGAVRAASSRRRNSIKHKTHGTGVMGQMKL